MTDPRKQAFAPYLRRLADLLGLKDWRIDLDDDAPADPDAFAFVSLAYGRKIATIRLGDRFLDGAPKEQRHGLAHELIHCHMEPAWEIAADAMPEAARAAFRRMAEYGIDGLADGIGPLLPMPDLGCTDTLRG